MITQKIINSKEQNRALKSVNIKITLAQGLAFDQNAIKAKYLHSFALLQTTENRQVQLYFTLAIKLTLEVQDASKIVKSSRNTGRQRTSMYVDNNCGENNVSRHVPISDYRQPRLDSQLIELLEISPCDILTITCIGPRCHFSYQFRPLLPNGFPERDVSLLPFLVSLHRTTRFVLPMCQSRRAFWYVRDSSDDVGPGQLALKGSVV